MFTIVPRLAAASTAAMSFEPVTAAGLGWAILGQSVTPQQLLGAAIIVGALLLLGSKH